MMENKQEYISNIAIMELNIIYNDRHHITSHLTNNLMYLSITLPKPALQVQ